jgi:hypothetical protein
MDKVLIDSCILIDFLKGVPEIEQEVDKISRILDLYQTYPSINN